MSRLHRLVFGEGGESMSGGEAERIRKMAAYCGAFWHHGDDIVDAWEDGGSELRPPGEPLIPETARRGYVCGI